MARNYSIFQFEGTLDNITFYQKDGQSFVKKKSRVSRNRIMNDPSFKRTRENMKEFGCSAKMCKVYKDAFGGVWRQMSESYTCSRITGSMKLLNRVGLGPRGERAFDVVDNQELLNKFEFNRHTPLNSVFFAPFATPTINATRDVVSLTIPDFNTDSRVVAPEGATHFRLVLACGYLSDYEFSVALNDYVPVSDDVNGRGEVVFSGDIPLGGMVGTATTLEVDMSSFGVIPVTSLLLGAVGIVFYQEVNSVLYELSGGNAMRVVVTG